MKNYVLVGDVHSQYLQLVSAISYIRENIENYYIIFLGDLFDSRNDYTNSVGVYNLVRNLEAEDKCLVLQSNHQNKYIRHLIGHNVCTNHGLDRTILDFNNSDIEVTSLCEWLEGHPYGVVFKDKDGLEYRCSHAYFSSKLFVPNDYSDLYLVHNVSKNTKRKCLYGLISDNKRVEWWNESRDRDWIRVAGHYHHVHIDLVNTKSIVLDGECGNEGGKLFIYNVNSKEAIEF